MKAMETLAKKLSDISGSSAIIVSHDMHLATTFADMIVKVRKKDEHGYIDASSVFLFDSVSGQWSNGEVSFAPTDFEIYLRKKL